MAIYKPSNLYPNLKEVDLTEDNMFSCQVNTSGETVKAYKIGFLSSSNKELFFPDSVNLLASKYVKNKQNLQIPVLANISPNLVNLKNDYYKWKLRLYNAPLSSTEQPNTKVCEGFLVGSTKSVIWTGNNTEIETDRWIEFKTTGSDNIMPVLEPNDDNINLPASGEEFIERYKITWVTDKLGFDKDITKIECDEDFKYNYKNGTVFNLYNCSSKHGIKNFFTDPNDVINLSNHVVIYASKTDKETVESQGNIAEENFPYTTGVTIIEQPHKIIGYSSDTGEVRVQEDFSTVPKNGQYYVVYEYNSETKKYNLKTSNTSQIIGGKNLGNFTLINNEWNTTTKQLFIQPNINIKSDATNPEELIFSDGKRVDIIQKFSTTLTTEKKVDITIDKLDNTQWLLKSISCFNNETPSIIPKTTYIVYTDFVDSMPDCVFYPRKTSTLSISYKNLNIADDFYKELSDAAALDLRDIAFKGNWTSIDNVQIKYYKYYLIDRNDNIIGYSNDIYDNELYWSFRGLEWDEVNNIAGQYAIKLEVVDEYNKVFSETVLFTTQYDTVLGVIDAELDYETNSIQITVIPPKTIEPIDDGDLKKVDNTNINRDKDYLTIPSGRVLKYGKMIDTPYSDLIFPETFCVLTQFQVTSDFLTHISLGGELPIFEVSHKNKLGNIDTYTLKISGFEKYYIIDGIDGNKIVKINDNQFHLRLYLNNSSVPISCFDDGTANFCNIVEYLTDLYSSQHIYYSIQVDKGYVFVDVFPPNPDNNALYVLKEKITYKNVMYPQGVYYYKDKKWNQDISAEYIFVENLSQIQSETPYTYSNLNAPENTRAVDGSGDLIINSEGNVWLDTKINCKEINEITMNRKWIVFYLTVDNTDKDITKVLCYVKGNNEGV